MPHFNRFNESINQLFLDMAKVGVSSLSNWPSYTHPEFDNTSSVFQSKYGKKYSPEQLQDLIKNAVLEISKNPNLAEIEDKDLAAELVKAFRAGSISPTTSDIISKRAVRQLLDFLKTQPSTSAQTIVNTVAVAAKDAEQKPEQAEQIADQGAEVAAAQAIEPVQSKETQPENTPQPSAQSSTETTSGEAMKNDWSEVFNREFSVLEVYYDQVVEKIEALNKKLSGKGIPTVSIEKTGVKTVKVPEREELFKEITFKVNVPGLQLPGGWKFVARVDHEAIGNLIVSAPNTGHEKDLHKLYGNSQPSFCDHCQTTRKRTSTFVIEDEKGNLKRIGRQCLRDYLPGGEKAVSSILNYAEYITKIAEGLIELEEKEKDPDYESMGGSSRYSNFGIKGVLGMGLAFIRTQGYTSKSKAQTINYQGNSFVEPTSDKVMRALTGELEKAIRQFGQGKAATELGSDVKAWEKYKDNPEKFQEEADKIIEWGKDYVAKQLEKPSSMTEYYRNLQTILNGATESGSIPKKYVGYLISVIPAYEKAKNGDGDEQSKEGKTKEEKNSEYVGTVGMPIGELSAADKRKYKGTDLSGFPFNGPINVTVTGSRQFERQGFGYYDLGGTTTMVNMVDDKGNVYVYFDNHTDEYEKGQKLVIKRALVKNHKDYTNKNTGKVVKQTLLTRATIEQGVNESALPPFREFFLEAQYADISI